MNIKYFRLKISLLEVTPEVWRSFVVPSDISLDRLHDIIQILLGWQDSHLHEFNFAKNRYVENIDEDFDSEETLLEGTVRLNKLFKKKGDECIYVYDFGDSWSHKILLEETDYKLRANDCEICCLDGARACPPEDVGGPSGYEDFCKAMKSAKNANHEAMAVWSMGFQPTGKKYDPKYFDIYAINEKLGWFVRWSRQRVLP